MPKQSPQLALLALIGATCDHQNSELKSRVPKCIIGHMKRSLSAITVICAMFIATASATAATVSGTLTGGRGLHVVVVQSNGTSKKATITKKGTFKVVGARLAGASIQLVGKNGTYFGPILLGGSGKKVYETIKGSGNLALGTFKRKSGYAAARAPVGRYFTTAAYTVAAKNGKPIGAGKYGLVKVGNGKSTLKGYNGQGRDADLDGIPGAFDIDDNGNLIIDNVDRTPRLGRSLRQFSPALRVSDTCPTPDQTQPPGCIPPSGAPSGGTTTEFKLFSNFKLTDATSINVSIPGITGIDALIDAAVPTIVTLATQVMGATSSTLDCLGNTYCAPHGEYPLVNFVAATYTGAFLNLVKGTTGDGGDAQITPGAARTAIGSGNAFLQIDGTTSYPGVLNFVFNTAPALKSYNVGAGEQTLTYDASGVSASGMTPSTRITTTAGATSITVTFWRPQRSALSSEAWFGSANPWTDIGGLAYRADTPNAPTGSTKNSCAGGYSAGRANGVAVTAGTDGIIDPAIDAEASTANTISWTIDLATCFDWSSMASGTSFHLDIQAFSTYGDNAARKLYFRKG